MAEIRVAAWNGVKYRYAATVGMFAVECPRCAILFMVPQRFQDARRSDRETFYCPHGHSMSYSDNTESILRKKLAKAEQDIERIRADERAAWDLARERRIEAEAERRRHGATKGQLTKARRRAAAGVCPCCHRTFQQVARHMASQHPGFDPEAAS